MKATYAALVTDDVVWMVPEGTSLRGWSAIADFVAQFEGVNEFTWTNRMVRGSGNLAYRTIDYVMRADVVGSEDEVVYPGKLITVYRRGPDGSWKIEAEMWNASPAS